MASSLRAIPTVGSIAPDFEVFDHTNRPLMLGFYRGAPGREQWNVALHNLPRLGA